jgi:hypothetical protein
MSVAEMQLTSLELALVAEFNLEMAAGYDEVAEDPASAAESREAARAAADRQRERAWLFQVEAQRRRASPMTTRGGFTATAPTRYEGPERRTRERREGERRSGQSLLSARPGQGDRRVNPDRRQRERRTGGRIWAERAREPELTPG